MKNEVLERLTIDSHRYRWVCHIVATIFLSGPATFQAEHWAFRPVTSPGIPEGKGTWVRTPIDAFIAAEHQTRGLVPSAEAPRRVLARRLSLDLTGLPPAVEELEAFLADSSPDAYERHVERLLASPRYGERWGRHWLDLARWADTEGYEYNHLRSFAWRYRDYVVQSFNEDKPYDRFIREQIAGDELVPYSDTNLIATGFLAATRLDGNGEDEPRQRNDMLVDITNATGSALLGLTIGCAQCHDHKFDPITQRDYYSLQGFFIKGQPGNLVLQDSAEWAEYKAVYAATAPPEYGAAKKLQELLLDGARARLVAKAKETLSPEARQALETDAAARTPEQQALAAEAESKLELTRQEVEKGIADEDRKLYEELKKKLNALEKQLPSPPQTWGFYSPATSPNAVDVLPNKGNYPLPYQPKQLARARPRLLVRGDVTQRGPEVDARWPAIFQPLPAGPFDKTPRLALADWLTSPRNPLTARVWVNRLWHYHFGRGLVVTPSDFGVGGAPPSHPQLLDWLAAELMRNGWSTKHIHRLIALSNTYRQASQPHANNAGIDPENLYLWRWLPRRLEAEVIRDSMLFVSGELDPAVGGPSVPADKGAELHDAQIVHHDTASHRRTLYLLQNRLVPPSFQALFDGPAGIAESCARRHVSTSALQPLYLLNNEFACDRARSFAARVRLLAGDQRDRQINSAFRLALAREPDEPEVKAAEQFFEFCAANATGPGAEPALEQFCQSLLSLNEFVYAE